MRVLFVVLVIVIWALTNADQTSSPKSFFTFRTYDDIPQQLFAGFEGCNWMDEQVSDERNDAQQPDKTRNGNGIQLNASFHDCITNDFKWDDESCPVRILTSTPPNHHSKDKLFNSIIYQMVSFIPIRVNELQLLFNPANDSTEFDLESKNLSKQLHVPQELIDISQLVSFSNGKWFVSDILHSLKHQFENYSRVWMSVIAGRQNTLAKYLVHMIRVLSAFCAEEFPRQAITDKGYELLKEFKVASEGNQNLDEIVQTSLADNLMRKLHDICEIRLLPKEKFFTFADDTESQYDGTFEKLMLCFGPCQEKIRLLKKMITRATRVFQEKWENDLKLLVDARFLIRHFKSESSNYIYRTIPYNYGLVIKNKKEGESSVLDDSVCEGILENCCIPISLLTPLRHYLQVNLNLQITK